MHTLVSINDLLTNLASPDWTLFDCRFALTDPEAGLKSYHLDHIPRAHYSDLNADLSDPVIAGQTGRHPLPAMDRWVERVRGWGIERSTQVVAYDDSGGPFAARLWWLFRWSGHRRVAVVDGGWRAWINSKYPTTPEPPDPVPESSFDAGPPITRTIDADALLARIQSDRIHLLDAREGARFRAEEEPLDTVAGHIPGATCVPFGENLDRNGFFRSAAQLKERFDRHCPNGQDVVCYCGSGVTAAHNILAIVHAGFQEPILYGGSWSEWILDPQRPTETG